MNSTVLYVYSSIHGPTNTQSKYFLMKYDVDWNSVAIVRRVVTFKLFCIPALCFTKEKKGILRSFPIRYATGSTMNKVNLWTICQPPLSGTHMIYARCEKKFYCFIFSWCGLCASVGGWMKMAIKYLFAHIWATLRTAVYFYLPQLGKLLVSTGSSEYT